MTLDRKWHYLPGQPQRLAPGSWDLPTGPTLGPQPGYKGRIVIEVWEPGADQWDGIRYSVQGGGSDRDDILTFVKDAVTRLAKRL